MYNAKIRNIEDKISDITYLATKTTLNAKINEVKGKIPSFTNLATTAAFIAVENKVPILLIQSKKTEYNTKINETENKISGNVFDKYITTPEISKLTAKYFDARLSNLARKSDIANFVQKTDLADKLKNLNKEITSNQTKHLLVENEFKKLKIFDSSFVIGQSYFNIQLNNFSTNLQNYYKRFLVLRTQSQNRNLRDCQMKKLNLLLQ